MTDSLPGVRASVVWGVRWGLYYATGLSAWVVIVRLVSGSLPFAELNTTFAQTVAFYFAGGFVAGGFVGLCRPFVKNQVSAALIGVLAAVPVCVLLKYVIAPGPWGPADTFMVVLCSLFYGVVMGPIMFRQGQRRQRRQKL